jgi:hypothetical protein
MTRRSSARPSVVVTDGGRDSSRNLGQEHHRILQELRHQFDRHPAIEDVRGVPNGKFRELRANLDPGAFGHDAEDASLRVSWWPAPDDPEYVIHYSESTGFDCGFHREPNPHVEGKTHYQVRSSPDETSEYEAVDLAPRTPTRLLWTVLDLLADRLD